MLNSQETRILNVLIELKSREITFSAIQGKILLKQEFSDELQISTNIKDIAIRDDSLLFTESIQNTTQIFPLSHNVRFLPVSAPGRWHNAIRVR